MRAKGTSKAAFDRMERVSAILALRYSGKSLAEIGAKQVPPVSAQAIHALIQRALGQIPQSATADIRLLECNRLDMLQASIWPAAMLGDIAAIDRVLAIHEAQSPDARPRCPARILWRRQRRRSRPRRCSCRDHRQP